MGFLPWPSDEPATHLENVLAELDASLEGGSRHRREIVDELAAHFQDLVDAEMPSRRALSRALERFGSPATVAEEFNAIRRARLQRRTRVGILLAVIVALVGAPSVLTTAAPRGPRFSSRRRPKELASPTSDSIW